MNLCFKITEGRLEQVTWPTSGRWVRSSVRNAFIAATGINETAYKKIANLQYLTINQQLQHILKHLQNLHYFLNITLFTQLQKNFQQLISSKLTYNRETTTINENKQTTFLCNTIYFYGNRRRSWFVQHKHESDGVKMVLTRTIYYHLGRYTLNTNYCIPPLRCKLIAYLRPKKDTLNPMRKAIAK